MNGSEDRHSVSAANAYQVYLPLVLTEPNNYSLGFNASGQEFITSDGRYYLADQPYTSANKAGYIGGSTSTILADATWEPIIGTDNDRLYRAARKGMTEYRFDLPNGHYIVELHFAEIRLHGPDFRVFDVFIEKSPVLQTFDIYDQAQHDYALDYRFPITVHDGQLNVTFTSLSHESLLSAIWVSSAQPDTMAPTAPTSLATTGSYHTVILTWPDVQQHDLKGYHIYRSQKDSQAFQLITKQPVPISRYLDQSVDPLEYCYWISAVDVYNNESAGSPISCATPVTEKDATLPLFQLWLSEDNLNQLNANLYHDYVPASFAHNGMRQSVEARYRGGIHRKANKKSWRIKFDDPFSFSKQESLLLHSEYYDPSIIREKISYDIFDEVGIRPLESNWVALQLNNDFAGVYTQIENPDRDYLRRTSRNQEADLYKCIDGLDSEPDCENQTNERIKDEALYEFAKVVNNTPDLEFPSAIAAVLDVKRFLDYQAVIALTANSDVAHQYLLYHDPNSGQWEVLPWDNDNTFRQPQLPIDFGTIYHTDGGAYNILLTRVLDVPQYRDYYSKRLLELTNGLFSPSNMELRINTAFDQIRTEVERDPGHILRDHPELFATQPTLLDSFVTERVAYLQNTIPDYMPAQSLYLNLNEIMVNNRTTVVDPVDGDAEPWLELYNAGVESLDLSGMYLTNEMGDPTRFRIPNGVTIPPLGFVIFWADGEPEQGSTHTNFVLSKNDSQLALFAPDGTTPLEIVKLKIKSKDISYARYPDGAGDWRPFTDSTPNESNRLRAPDISHVKQQPIYPTEEDTVTITAIISDDGGVTSALLYYKLDETFIAKPMFDDGHHGDGAAGDQIYGTQIPAHANGVEVQYYLLAENNHGRQTTSPLAAPVLTDDYMVGYEPVPVLINEFMASNDTVLEDPDEPGEYPDWIELYNYGPTPINLGGLYLSDNLSNPTKFRLDDTITIQAGGFVILWADDDPEQSPFHTNFKLSAAGEVIALFDRDGVTEIDTISFTTQQRDVSFGRWPNGAQRWLFLGCSTPEQDNNCYRLFLPLVNN